MKIGINPDDPTPLYLQIAQEIRARIRAGELEPGDQLVPLRKAAQLWGVNLHTVRHAYAALAREGLVETSRARHTQVVALAEAPATIGSRESAVSGGLPRFIERTLERARQQFGLNRHELADLFAGQKLGDAVSCPRAYVVECSEWECAGHADELRAKWAVDARPWSLERAGEPPEGLIVATYFHYNDIRRRWPHRLRAVRFMTIGPDPTLIARLPAPRNRTNPIRLVVCEFDEPTVHAIAADLSLLLPAPRYDLRTVVANDSRAMLSQVVTGEHALLPPRVWAQLDEADRADVRAIEARYIFDPGELDLIGGELGWRRAASTAGMPAQSWRTSQ